MPERQTSPGGVTATPETDASTNGGGSHPVAPDGNGHNGHAPSAASPVAAPTVAEQVAEQVAAEPAAVDPASDPGDPAPPPSETVPVTDGASVVEAATDHADGATGTPAAASSLPDPAPAPDDPAAVDPATEAAAATGAPTGPGAAEPASSAQPGPAAGATGPASPPAPEAPGTPAAAVPARPRPRPFRAEPAALAPAQAPVAGPVPVEEPTVAVRIDAPAAAAAKASAATGSPTTGAPTTGGRGSWFTASDAESTQMIPRTDAAGAAEPDAPASRSAEPDTRPASTGSPAAPGIDQPTEQLFRAVPAVPGPPASEPGPAGGAAEPDGDEPTTPARTGGRRRVLLITGAVLLVLAALYGGDLALSAGSVPRGVSVAGVQVGGLAVGEAEQRLRAEIEPRSTRPVAVTVGEARAEIDPRVAGLVVDWTATLDQAGSQPLNPFTRISSFFTGRDVGVVTSTDRPALDAALAELAPIVGRAPIEGTVRFEGTTPVPVDPVAGQELDLPGAAAVLEREWVNGRPVALPLSALPPITTPAAVAAAVADVARPAVSGPVAVTGEGGTQGTLTPEVIAAALSFRPDPAGALVPELNQTALAEALTPQLAASEKPSRDAVLDFSSGAPVVVPSQDGRGIDYPATFKDLLPVLVGTGPRQVTAVYADKPADLTTDELNALGITGVIGEFTTGGFATDSGKNIRRASDQINGTIVAPGETFSLNALTNPRDASNGYVEAGIISDGHPSRGIGGGVSQVATTTYNAAYFAGMTDVAHKEHSFYIGRYPPGREATVFDNVIDLKFRNDNPSAVMIQTVWTPSSLTVRIFGTKRYDVTSTTGPRTNPTNPNTITIPAGEPCSPSQGAPGFTVTDTRTLREISTGQVRSETRTVRYNPSPIVICEG